MGPQPLEHLGPVTARIPLRIGNDLTQLGLSEAPNRESLLVRDAQTGAIVPHAVDGHDLLLDLTSPGTASTARFFACFGLNQYDFRQPLAARRQTVPATPANKKAFEFADYAQVRYGDPWGFEEGDNEGIDRWGNKPSFVRNRRVENGILKMTVSQDPWFAWAPSLALAPTDRRAVTDSDGRTAVTVHCSPRAGTKTTRFTVTPEFAETTKASVAWDTQ